jgi:hypothetical protein
MMLPQHLQLLQVCSICPGFAGRVFSHAEILPLAADSLSFCFLAFVCSGKLSVGQTAQQVACYFAHGCAGPWEPLALLHGVFQVLAATKSMQVASC